MKLIPKDAVLAVIDNILDYVDEHWYTDYATGAKRFADKLQDAIDTLEVKEVELDKPFKGISVNTSFDGDDNLDTITITTKYYKKKGG